MSRIKDMMNTMNTGARNLAHNVADGAKNLANDAMNKINPTTSSKPKFKAIATVEDDMMMEFEVLSMQGYGNDVTLTVVRPGKTQKLLVDVGGGPMYDALNPAKVVFRDSTFSNINKNNCGQIAKKYGIEFAMAD